MVDEWLLRLSRETIWFICGFTWLLNEPCAPCANEYWTGLDWIIDDNLRQVSLFKIHTSLRNQIKRMSGNALPRAALKVPLSLGIGRYVCQLKRLTFKFCKSRPDSGGVRDFIEKDIVDFAKSNPAVTVYVKPRRHRAPLLVAEYRKFIFFQLVHYFVLVSLQTSYFSVHCFSQWQLAIPPYGENVSRRDQRMGAIYAYPLW